jgi:hypothetical protein
MPHNEAQRISNKGYSPDYLKGAFSEVLPDMLLLLVEP